MTGIRSGTNGATPWRQPWPAPCPCRQRCWRRSMAATRRWSLLAGAAGPICVGRCGPGADRPLAFAGAPRAGRADRRPVRGVGRRQRPPLGRALCLVRAAAVHAAGRCRSLWPLSSAPWSGAWRAGASISGTAPASSCCLLPFLFNQLLLLGSTPRIEELGWRLVLKADIGVEVWRIIGRTAVLLLFTEVLLVGVGFVMDRRWLKEWRLHGLHPRLRRACGRDSPPIADMGSTGARLAGPPARHRRARPWPSPACGARPSSSPACCSTPSATAAPPGALSARHWRSGAVKGAIYAGLFMALVQISRHRRRQPHGLAMARGRPLPVGTLLGALLFPLAAHHRRELRRQRALLPPAAGATPAIPGPMCSGLIVGVGVGLAFGHGLPDGRTAAPASCSASPSAASPMPASTSPAICGPSRQRRPPAAAGLARLRAGRRCSAASSAAPSPGISMPPSSRSSRDKFWPPTRTHRAGRPQAYVIYPLFSKWGAIDLGAATGGVRLLYNESLSGVINWSLAAPLFSINLVLLTALFERSLDPIARLFSAARPGRPGRAGDPRAALGPVDGADHLLLPAHGARSHLVQPGRRGAHRGRRARRAGSSTPEAFRAWSLEVFLGLLAYDWLRVLIWFDHMGLRVATLVNLSFVGGDRARRARRPLARPLRPHARHPRGHPPLRHLGAAADPVLHPARRRMGPGLDRGRARAQRRRGRCCRRSTCCWSATASPRGALAVAWSALAAPRRAPPAATGGTASGRGPLQHRQRASTPLELLADGRGYSRALQLRAAAASRSTSPAAPTTRSQLRGKLFYLREPRPGAAGPPGRWAGSRCRMPGRTTRSSSRRRPALRIVNSRGRHPRRGHGRASPPTSAVETLAAAAAQPRGRGRAASS